MKNTYKPTTSEVKRKSNFQRIYIGRERGRKRERVLVHISHPYSTATPLSIWVQELNSGIITISYVGKHSYCFLNCYCNRWEWSCLVLVVPQASCLLQLTDHHHPHSLNDVLVVYVDGTRGFLQLDRACFHLLIARLLRLPHWFSLFYFWKLNRC